MKKRLKKILKYSALAFTGLLIVFGTYFWTVKQLNERLIEEMQPTTAQTVIDTTSPLLLKSRFLAGERFYLLMPTRNGDTISAYCDTGGGISFLIPASVNKANVESFVRTGIFNGLLPMKYVPFSDLVTDPAYPHPEVSRQKVLRAPFSRITDPFLIVPSMDKELKMGLSVQPEMEAFLAQDFFMKKAWTFDYPRRQVWVHTPLDPSQSALPNVQKLGFKKNAHQEAIFGHPRMVISVEGEFIDVLFDTGATSILTPQGREQLQTEELSVGSSFIAASIFDRWRTQHPEWKYYPKAEWIGDMIEVPLVNVSGFDVGPVLFARRRDEAWSQGMIASMDQVVQGAVGGSLLKFFEVQIDYNSELIKFERPE